VELLEELVVRWVAFRSAFSGSIGMLGYGVCGGSAWPHGKRWGNWKTMKDDRGTAVWKQGASMHIDPCVVAMVARTNWASTNIDMCCNQILTRNMRVRGPLETKPSHSARRSSRPYVDHIQIRFSGYKPLETLELGRHCAPSMVIG
jgi:hypothetical protein